MLSGVVHLDTRREVFEFAPLLVELLSPYPYVDIVLTTNWLNRLTLDEAVFCLPPELARRVVGAVQESESKLSFTQHAVDRRDVIALYANARRLRTWLVIGDENNCQFDCKSDVTLDHFLLLDPERGISDVRAYMYIQRWFRQVHEVDDLSQSQ